MCFAGYNEVEVGSDHELAFAPVAKLTVQARQQLGLVTHQSTPAVYTHGNGVTEEPLSRAKGVAGSLMYRLMEKFKVAFGTSHAPWSWAMKHAAWLLNRHKLYKDLTSYEIVFGKPFDGLACEFAEPIFYFLENPHKGQCTMAKDDIPGKSGMSRQCFFLSWENFSVDTFNTKGAD